MKANELTWQDIELIIKIADNALDRIDRELLVKMGEVGYYTAILDMFNETKNNNP